MNRSTQLLAPPSIFRRFLARDPSHPLAWDLISYLMVMIGIFFIVTTMAVILHHPFVGFISLTMPAYTQVVDPATGQLLPFDQALIGMWRGYEDHRFVIPGLIYYVNQLVFGPVNILPSTIALICRLALFGWLVRAILTRFPAEPFSSRVLIGLIAVLTFQTVDADVYYTTDLGWVPLVTFFAILALDRFAGTPAPTPWPAASAVMILALALLSGAPGLFLWPIVLTLAIIRRCRPREFAAILACALVTYGLYFYRYASSAGGGPGYEAGNLGVLITAYPLHFLRWIGLYAGLPFGNALFFKPVNAFSAAASIMAGLGAIGIAGAITVWSAITGRYRDRTDLWLIGVALFSALWAAATAIKHGAPFGVIGSEQGGPLLHSRFYFGQVWLFVAVAILSWRALASRPAGERAFGLALLGAAAIMSPVQLFGTLAALR